MKIFKQIVSFILCFLREDCEYSIKKLLVYLFTGVSIYLIIFTNKDYYEVLMFIGVLLGIRTYERLKTSKPSAEGIGENSTLGMKKRMD
jgi:hypothetical protein